MGEKVGITFAFARVFHPAMRFVGPIRAQLGVPCVFNVLGPITNPAHPKHCVIGCADRSLGSIMADVLHKQGATGMVFTSNEGMDELAPTGPVTLWHIEDDGVTESTFDPITQLGLAKVEVSDLKGDTPEYNAQVARDVIAGRDLPCTSTILLNAAAAIAVNTQLLSEPDAPLSQRIGEAYGIAKKTVESGAATDKLNEWIETAKAVKAGSAA